jgi:hypothetical protein
MKVEFNRIFINRIVNQMALFPVVTPAASFHHTRHLINYAISAFMAEKPPVADNYRYCLSGLGLRENFTSNKNKSVSRESIAIGSTVSLLGVSCPCRSECRRRHAANQVMKTGSQLAAMRESFPGNAQVIDLAIGVASRSDRHTLERESKNPCITYLGVTTENGL